MEIKDHGNMRCEMSRCYLEKLFTSYEGKNHVQVYNLNDFSAKNQVLKCMKMTRGGGGGGFFGFLSLFFSLGRIRAMDVREREAVEENDDGNKSDKDSKMSTNKSSGNNDTEDEAQGEDGSEIRSRSLGKPSYTELQRMHARAAQKTAEIEGKDEDDNDGQNSDERQGDKRLKHRKGELEQWNFYQVQEVEQFTVVKVKYDAYCPGFLREFFTGQPIWKKFAAQTRRRCDSESQTDEERRHPNRALSELGNQNAIEGPEFLKRAWSLHE